MVTPALGFHTTEWFNLMVCGFCIFSAIRTAISPSPLPGLCHSTITIIATSLILLLAILLLMLFNTAHVRKVLLLTSWQRGRIALMNRPGQQCARFNIKFTCSQLHSACPIFKPVVLKVGHIAPKGATSHFYWATGE
jgi:hypothetical protein